MFPLPEKLAICFRAPHLADKPPYLVLCLCQVLFTNAIDFFQSCYSLEPGDCQLEEFFSMIKRTNLTAYITTGLRLSTRRKIDLGSFGLVLEAVVPGVGLQSTRTSGWAMIF